MPVMFGGLIHWAFHGLLPAAFTARAQPGFVKQALKTNSAKTKKCFIGDYRLTGCCLLKDNIENKWD